MSSITCHFVLSLVKIRLFREADGIDQYSRKASSSEAIKHLLTEQLLMHKRKKKCFTWSKAPKIDSYIYIILYIPAVQYQV